MAVGVALACGPCGSCGPCGPCALVALEALVALVALVAHVALVTLLLGGSTTGLGCYPGDLGVLFCLPRLIGCA